MNTRQIILVSLLVLLVGALSVWWYFGFSLDFMRFFAAEPTATIAPATDTGTTTARATCQPRPACLDAVSPCDIAEPVGGWCPPTGGKPVSCVPNTQTVSVGAAASLTATGGDGNYSWFSPDGTPPFSSAMSKGTTARAYTVSYLTAGIKKVTVQSLRGGGTNDVDSAACTVVVTP